MEPEEQPVVSVARLLHPWKSDKVSACVCFALAAACTAYCVFV
jgi:hypothetical protein